MSESEVEIQPYSTVTRRRKPEKPLWRTGLNRLIKITKILVVAAIIHMVSKLIEGGISDVQPYIKTTTTKLQAQLESEVLSLRGEIKKFEEKNADLSSRLKILDQKIEFLDKALEQLRSKDLLSKEGLARFYQEFKKSEIGDSGHTDLILDGTRAFTKQMPEEEIGKHAADGLERVDYTLTTAGAMVVKHSEPFIVGNWFSMIKREGVHKNAEKMLKSSFGKPGQCFPLKGNSGFVQIKLRTVISPEAVTRA